jgi:hypothetical protein
VPEHGKYLGSATLSCPSGVNILLISGGSTVNSIKGGNSWKAGKLRALYVPAAVYCQEVESDRAAFA